MAHFCEHMLFMGTDKYPEEDGFNKFLAKRGGSSNAFTESESTTYYFNQQLDDNKLFPGGGDSYEGLDRFLDFFATPKFSLGSVSREVNAVDSEHSKNLQSDVFRIYELEKRRAAKEHPYSRFWTGDKTTLLPNGGDEKGRMELKDDLGGFFDGYYRKVGGNVVVIAPRGVDEMEKEVERIIKDFKGTYIKEPSKGEISTLPERIMPFSGDKGSSEIPGFGYVVKTVPVQDLRQITLVFPIVYASGGERDGIRRYRPVEYLGALVGHEGGGSVLSYLKGLGWANGVGAR